MFFLKSGLPQRFIRPRFAVATFPVQVTALDQKLPAIAQLQRERMLLLAGTVAIPDDFAFNRLHADKLWIPPITAEDRPLKTNFISDYCITGAVYRVLLSLHR
jgi:hypothetical protein